MSRLLVLSNGAGEDAIGARILNRLEESLKSRVICCPLVGPGSALNKAFELCGPRVEPPSEGLFREDWRLAVKDLAGGVIGGHLRQLGFLRKNRARFAGAVAVGDLFPVAMAGLAGIRPVLFVGTAKSVYHHRYSWLERMMLKFWVDLSVVRDEATAQELQSLGVNACWLGNAMMDEVQPRGLDLPFRAEGQVLTLFPGSRSQAPSVLPFQLQVFTELAGSIEELQAGVAVAPGSDLERLVGPSVEEGWEFRQGTGEHHLGSLEQDGREVHLMRDALGDLLRRSCVALGQAGTANEQAAGAGVPVVAYDPRGEKGLRWYRKRQKGLLGDAVAVVPERLDAVVKEMHLLLTDEGERERRARVGRERMGPPGGTLRMAQAIEELCGR